jgi:hypothetical protein
VELNPVKRRVVAASFIMVLLLSSIGIVMFVDLVVANPVWPNGFPITAVETPPAITFQSPIENQTYDCSSVWLNFTIVKPESWFLFTDEVLDEQGNPVTFTIVNITSVSYTIDGVTNTSIPIYDLHGLSAASPTRSLDFSINLTLPEGMHDVKVGFEAECFYVDTVYFTAENATEVWPAGVRLFDTSLSSVNTSGSSDILCFSIAGSFPTTIVVAAVASVVVVVVVLLFYFKKCRH